MINELVFCVGKVEKTWLDENTLDLEHQFSQDNKEDVLLIT